MKKVVLFLIKKYQGADKIITQILLSFGLPKHHCRFIPTCSEYTYQAVEKHGVIKGLFLGTKRIIRCRPGTKGGYDPLK